MGYDFCDTLLDYCDPDNTKVSEIAASICFCDTDDIRLAVLVYIIANKLSPEIRFFIFLPVLEQYNHFPLYNILKFK